MSVAVQRTWPPESPISDFAMLFAVAPVGIARCSLQGMLVPLNVAMERILADSGMHAAHLLLPSLLPEKHRADCEGFLRQMAGGTRDSFQLDFLAGNHAIHWTVWRPRSEEGAWQDPLALALERLLDPEQEHRNVRLETAGRLVSSVAHDFNNWITGVQLYSDLLLSSIDSNHPARKYVEEIRNAGVHATGFVRQLLSLTKPASCQPQLLSLNDIVEGMRNMLLRLMGENIHLRFQLDRKIGLVKIDPTQAQQILLNLVLNARDAMPHGGEIVIGTSDCKVQSLNGSTRSFFPCALFTVEDHGTGIDAAIRSRIFEPFFTTKAGKGTGLGLATVHEIVTSNGGLIHVDTEPGQGTRVTVLLPVIPKQPAPARSTNDFYPRNGEVPSSNNEESLP